MAETMDLGHSRPLEPDRQHVLGIMLTPETCQFLASTTGKGPADKALWKEALTHGSMGEERDFQKLEFLGDRVLGLVIAEWLYETGVPNEGKLSQRLNALVSGATCAKIARSIGLGHHLRLGKQVRDDGAHDSDHILGDGMEALIGACFIEQGFAGARAMVRTLWDDAVKGQSGKTKHPKSALQEWAAGNRRKPPLYRIIDRSGPDHRASFTIAVEVPGIGEAQATGSSKQEAETKAAAEFLRQYG